MIKKILLGTVPVLAVIAAIMTIFDVPHLGFLLRNAYIWYILATVFCIAITYFMVEYYMKSKQYRGVFAVSALVFCEKDKLLLIRADRKNPSGVGEFYVQPSGSYRKSYDKKIDTSRDMEKPYQKIFEILTGDNLNLFEGHLEAVSSIPLDFELIGNQKLSSFFARNKEVLHYDEQQDVDNISPRYRDNEISISPTLTITEKNSDTLSKEPFRVDFYYAFHLSAKNASIRERLQQGKCKFVTRDELKQLVKDGKTHGDLLAIYDVLHYAISVSKPNPVTELRTCTFNMSQKTAFWRITENCNCKCSYCFNNIKDANRKKANDQIAKEVINKVIGHLSTQKIKKLVITGGEPLLVSNLFEVLDDIDKADIPELKVSVCTNGLTYFQDLNNLVDIKSFDKFVVSVDGYDETSFSKHKKTFQQNKNTPPFSKVVNFIERAKQYDVNISVNTILTEDFMSETDKFLAFFKDSLEIRELSISVAVGSGSSGIDKGVVYDTRTAFWFYNEIINHHLSDFNFLKKLTYIMPNCGHFNNFDMCPSGSMVFYISPEGNFGGCNEYSLMLEKQGEVNSDNKN